jgi:hypothetical protein
MCPNVPVMLMPCEHFGLLDLDVEHFSLILTPSSMIYLIFTLEDEAGVVFCLI